MDAGTAGAARGISSVGPGARGEVSVAPDHLVADGAVRAGPDALGVAPAQVALDRVAALQIEPDLALSACGHAQPAPDTPLGVYCTAGPLRHQRECLSRACVHASGSFAEGADAADEDPDILGKDIQNNRPVTNREGVGVIEAPRGTLWHHYWVDEDGKLEKVNLIVATGNNNWAMTAAVDSVAKTYLDGKNVTEGALNRIEAAIRAYDPCLSCSTHAVGQMPLELVFVDKDDNEIRRYTRD